MCDVCLELEKKLGSRYIPIPYWRGTEWEPIAVALGEKRMCWPQGFSPQDLPRPKYQLGDIVTFLWSEGKTWTGYVQRIKLHGGCHSRYDGTALEVCALRYQRSLMTYTIYANGHGRWVREQKVIEKVGEKKGFFQ